MVRQVARFCAVIAFLALAGCGGDGESGSGGGGPLQVTPPAGTPPAGPATPPPPVGITYPGGLLAVSAPTTFVLLDSIFSNAAGTKLPAADLSLRWLGQPATFSLRIAGVGEGELRQNSASDPALQLVAPGGQVLMTGIDIAQAKGRYTGILQRFGDPFFAAAFGVATPQSGLPVTGARSYRGLPGTGSALRIDVDFSTRQASGTIDIAWEDAWGPYPPTTYNLVPTTLAQGATEFTMTFTVPGAPQGGEVVGRFAGPSGEELMASSKGQVKSPYDNSWVTQGRPEVLISTS